MDSTIIRNWNQRVKPEDAVYHLGDFCLRGSAKKWEDQLNGKIIHFVGNHDQNNKVRGLQAGIMGFGGMEVMLTHIPPFTKAAVPDFCDLVLCGHIHEKWKHIWVDDVLVVNVGVDVWKFMPVEMTELIAYCDQARKEQAPLDK